MLTKHFLSSPMCHSRGEAGCWLRQFLYLLLILFMIHFIDLLVRLLLTEILDWNLLEVTCSLMFFKQFYSVPSVWNSSCFFTWGVMFIENHKWCWCWSSFPDLWITKTQLSSVRVRQCPRLLYNLQSCLFLIFSQHAKTNNERAHSRYSLILFWILKSQTVELSDIGFFFNQKAVFPQNINSCV